MSAFGPYLRRGAGSRVYWYCPGCKSMHGVPTRGEHAWGFNENPDAPTLAPSVLSRTIRPNLTDAQWAEYDRVAEQGGSEAVLNHPVFGWRCHCFVTDGHIEFLDDCSHDLRGRVPMPRLEDVDRARDERIRAAMAGTDGPRVRKPAPGADSKKWRAV